MRAPHVKKVQFVSKDQAFAEQSKADPQAYQPVGGNPLPDTFRVIPDNPTTSTRSEARAAEASGGTPMLDAVDRDVSTTRERRAEDPRARRAW